VEAVFGGTWKTTCNIHRWLAAVRGKNGGWKKKNGNPLGHPRQGDATRNKRLKIRAREREERKRIVTRVRTIAEKIKMLSRSLKSRIV